MHPELSCLAPAQSRHHPAMQLLRFQEPLGLFLQFARGHPALNDRDDEVAAMRQGKADSRVRRVGHRQIIGARAAGHVGDVNDPACFKWHKARRNQLEIGDAIDLLVIGDTCVAIAKADFWPDIELDVAAIGTAEGAARGPAVRRKWP